MPGNLDTFINRPGSLNVVSYYAPWCKPCQILEPELEAAVLASDHPVRLRTVNVEKAPNLRVSEGVRGIPDVRFYLDGEMVGKFRGAIDRSRIDALIAKHGRPPG